MSAKWVGSAGGGGGGGGAVAWNDITGKPVLLTQDDGDGRYVRVTQLVIAATPPASPAAGTVYIDSAP
jgi:hypothetical protein